MLQKNTNWHIVDQADSDLDDTVVYISCGQWDEEQLRLTLHESVSYPNWLTGSTCISCSSFFRLPVPMISDEGVQSLALAIGHG